MAADKRTAIADTIMSMVVWQGREGTGVTSADREDHEYQFCANAADRIVAIDPGWPSLEDRLHALTLIYEGRAEADPQETAPWSEVAQDLRLLLQGANPGPSA